MLQGEILKKIRILFGKMELPDDIILVIFNILLEHQEYKTCINLAINYKNIFCDGQIEFLKCCNCPITVCEIGNLSALSYCIKDMNNLEIYYCAETACKFNHLELVKFLVNYDKKIAENTLLFRAAVVYNNNFELVKFLVESGSIDVSVFKNLAFRVSLVKHQNLEMIKYIFEKTADKDFLREYNVDVASIPDHIFIYLSKNKFKFSSGAQLLMVGKIKK